LERPTLAPPGEKGGEGHCCGPAHPEEAQ
jgi:hypothetical protein